MGTKSFLQNTADHGRMSIGKKIMLGQGYVEGQGLGADGSGIASALSIARNKPSKKKEKEKEVVLSGFKKAAGAIIDRNLAAQNHKSVEAYGEPSRTIQLSNLVDRADVDDDLSEEIGMPDRFVGCLALNLHRRGVREAWKCSQSVDTIRRQYRCANYSHVFWSCSSMDCKTSTGR